MNEEQISTVSCDGCGTEFDVRKEVREKRFKSKGGEMIFVRLFRCPECDKEYTISVTDPYLRNLIKKDKAIADTVRKRHGNGNENYFNNLIRKHDELREKIASYEKELKEKYTKGENET